LNFNLLYLRMKGFRMSKKPISNWLVPASLLALGGLQVLSGAFQLTLIGQGPPPDGDANLFASKHYFETPIPIVMHIVCGIVFSLLAPFQFSPSLRLRWPTWHRCSGRLLVVSGVLVAVSALWMNQIFPAFGGILKSAGIIVFSVGLIASLGLALWAILNRRIQRHRAWMMRAMAIGLGGATQRVFLLPVFVINGGLSELTIGLGVWFGFLLNLCVGEWILWRDRSRLSRRDVRIQTAKEFQANGERFRHGSSQITLDM
jgi:uncharacterized membrane protein